MTNEEVGALVEKYFRQEWAGFPEFEHRFDPDSSAIMYSIIRKFKPTRCLEIGSWLGGSTHIIMKALLKNGKQRFSFTCSEIDDRLRAETEKNVRKHTGKAPKMVGDITESLDLIPKQLDFLFVDTNHDREVTEWIVENIWPRLKRGGIFAMHDWAVWEEEGKLLGKGDGGAGALPETEYLMELIRTDKFPFKKLHWTFKNPVLSGQSEYWETAFWQKL